MKLSDEQIVDKIISGDIEKYEEIVTRYQAKLSRYIKKLTNRSDDVDDVLQEVFIKAYKNLRHFNQKMKFSSWIYRIAHNESINLIKSSWVQKITSLDPFFNLGQKNQIEDQIDNRQLQKKLANCLKDLELKYKEPLVLFYFEEKSYEEISDILRIPVKTVGVLIYRGRQKIKKLCQSIKND